MTPPQDPFLPPITTGQVCRAPLLVCCSHLSAFHRSVAKSKGPLSIADLFTGIGSTVGRSPSYLQDLCSLFSIIDDALPSFDGLLLAHDDLASMLSGFSIASSAQDQHQCHVFDQRWTCCCRHVGY